MNTVVVATDGSMGSCRAWRWATALAAASGARAISVPGYGAARVLSTADELEADLVVVAAHPYSVVDYVARHARRPFAVVPSVSECRAPARIAVGDDGSPGAVEASRWSAALAEATGAAIVAIDVVHPPGFLAPYLPELHANAVQEVERHWATPGVAVTADVVDDDHPGHALLAEAQRAGADLIVLGARALCGVRLLPRDGVTMTALRHARVPVVVAPARAVLLTARDGGSEEGYTVQRVVT